MQGTPKVAIAVKSDNCIGNLDNSTVKDTASTSISILIHATKEQSCTVPYVAYLQGVQKIFIQLMPLIFNYDPQSD